METWKAFALGGIIGFIGGVAAGLILGPLAGERVLQPNDKAAGGHSPATITPLPSLENEALAFYKQRLDGHFTHCGDSWFTYRDSFGNRIISQFKGEATFHVEPLQVTPADKANGIEWKGRAYAKGIGICRGWYDCQQEWTDWDDCDASWLFGLWGKLTKASGAWGLSGLDIGEQAISCGEVPPN